jgi:hypothetical protein
MDQSLSVTPYPCGSSRHEIEVIGCNEDILKEKEDHHEQHHQRNKNNEYSSFSPSPSCDVVKRTYYVYVPCSATSMVTNSSPLPLEVGYLPLVYALHGYTGDASSMKKWENIAQKFNFILVRPEGVNRSWNARYCCGYALENDITIPLPGEACQFMGHRPCAQPATLCCRVETNCHNPSDMLR